jgi:polysaccharide biosynthesis/export protein
MFHSLKWICIGLFFLTLGSCINSEFMFQRPIDFVYDELQIDSMSINYRIRPNDLVSFEIYTNEAALMLEVTTSQLNNISSVQRTNVEYVVDSEGMVEFPIIGQQMLAGLSVNEAQSKIEELYESQFNNPYVQLKVLNRRVIIFPAPRGRGLVLELKSQNISLIEGIALAGGVGQNGQAFDIMLVRDAAGDKKIYHIDLSTIEGLEYAKMSLESGDIIYVQPNKTLSAQFQTQIRPISGFFSAIASALALIAIFTK